ncbi:MAG TPA: hypothetical protein PLD46_07180 [Hyphomicrobium sp.]|nr:hypothetical protein [Hyphomicrobium sp.]
MRPFFANAIAVFAVLSATLALSPTHLNAASWPPPEIIGLWTGEGRLAFREGKFENVKCRVTYFADATVGLKQTVRCATAGAKIEVKSEITEIDGALTGKWQETVYNLAGDIAGKQTDRGFRVEVRSEQLSANMDLMLKDSKQVIEIQFLNSTLLGLTIVLSKSAPSAAVNP